MAAMRLLFVCLFLYCISFVFLFQLSYVMYSFSADFNKSPFKKTFSITLDTNGKLDKGLYKYVGQESASSTMFLFDNIRVSSYPG